MGAELAGRTAVVTGASKGIGLAVVNALAASGAHVVAGARRTSPELAELAKAGQVEAVEVDLASPAGPARLVAAAGARVDILVNNVGGAPAAARRLPYITDEDWLATQPRPDGRGPGHPQRAAVHARPRGGRHHQRLLGERRLPDPAVLDYSAAKAGLAAFSKALAKEVGPQGVRVNTVSPGPVATDLWLGAGGVAQTVGAATGARPADVASQAASQLVTGRFTQPAEIAGLVLFLAGDGAANITGADFTIDGGLVPTW